ncbi:MAG TPA: hypothetical protein VM425_17045 [Myxococcota bacterium]|nr:hypothetical protein [Myxococcota bacterium]
MSKANTICMSLIFLLLDYAVPAAVPAGGDKIEVRSVEIERAAGELYFSVELNWPADGVSENYSEFSHKQGPEFTREWNWAPGALALIPRDKTASLVFRSLAAENDRQTHMPFISPGTSRRPPAQVRFLGKLSKKAAVDFLVRFPNPEGDYSYQTIGVDFTKARYARGLAQDWTMAEANFMIAYLAPADQSFFAYAFECLRKRMKKGGSGMSFRQTRRTAGRGELYEVTTGALALQESLQLDRLTATSRDRGKRNIPVSKIAGVTVRSHPWKEMIGDDKPAIEEIAGLVPADQYYIRFTTSRSLRTFLDFLDAWGGSLLSQLEMGGRDYGTREKIERQICIRASWLSDLLGPAVVESLVVTGSDPYLREGSDFSLIFHLKSQALFETAVGRYIDEARKRRPDLKESRQSYRGVSIQRFLTDDRQVSCHRAKLGDYYVYSNSSTAIRSIIDAKQGRRPALAKSLDFIYMRTLYPLGKKNEDGLIFLSDPWLRMLTGPALRISEKRRIETVTSLEMAKNAALFYLWEHPASRVPGMGALVKLGYLDRKKLYAEPGDSISWDPAAFAAVSKKYGRLGYLTPNIEIPVGQVSQQEKNEYETFRRFYQDYWRRYFDPIGIRVTAGRDIALSVTILPLIDNSEYNHTKIAFGGRALDLEPLARSGPVVFHYAAHLNPDSPDLKRAQSFAVNMLGNNRATVEWIGERIEFWVEDNEILGGLIEHENAKNLFKVPMVFGIEIKSKLGLAAFLVALQSVVKTGAPGLVSFEPTDPYKGAAFTAIKPAPGSHADDELKDAAIYYGAVGDMLYVSTSLEALKHIVDTGSKAAKNPETAAMRFGAAGKAHMALRLDLEAARKTFLLAQKLLASLSVPAEREHLRNLWLVAHTAGLGPGARIKPEQVLGYRIASAFGNSFEYDPEHDQVVGSLSGSLWQPKKVERPSPDSPLGRLLDSLRSLRATLEFTKDGLHTELSVRRK